MAASVQFRPQNRDLGMVMREVDEDLAIFLGIRNSERGKNDHVLFEESDMFDDSKRAEPLGESFLIAADDNLLNLETERLLTQVDSSLLPSVEFNVHDSAASPNKTSNGESISLKSEMENTSEVSASQSDASTSVESANRRRPLSSDERKPTRRAATPTGRPSLPAKPKPSRASTPTSRATLPSSKPVVAQARSSTPVRPTSRSSTPASRPSVPVVSKSAPRSTTPTRKPVAPSTSSDRSSSGRKTGPTMYKSSVSSRGVLSKSSKPSDTLSLSHDAPQNPKVSMPKRPVSASRGRQSTPATHLSLSNEKTRRRSCSPPKVRAPIGTAYKTGSKMLSKSRGYEGDYVNPVVMGTKMVDRVVNMRKLAPPKQDEYVSHDNPRKSSQENSGFGRSLSKKSLDMAIRHMDIRRSIGEKLRPPGVKSDCAKISESRQTSNCDSSNSSNCTSSHLLNG